MFKNVMLITCFSVATRALGFLFRIFLSREIGAEALGLYQATLSVFFVLLTVVSSGLPLIISRNEASFKVKRDEKSKKRLISSSLLIGIVVSLVLSLIVIICKNLFKLVFTDDNCVLILLILLPSLVFSAVYSVFRGMLWGDGRYFSLCASELFEQIVKIAVAVLLLGGTLSVLESAMNVAWAFTISCIASAVFVVIMYFAYGGKLGKPNMSRKILKESTPITGVRVATSLAQPLIALIIPWRLSQIGYTTAQAMSLYGIAVGMTFPLLFLPSTLIGSLSTALIPDISSAIAQNNTKHIENRAKTSMLFTIFISSMIVPIYLGLGSLIGNFLYNEPISGALLEVASFVLIPLGITNITSALLNSLGLEIKSFINSVIGAIFMFVAIMILPSFIGVNALAGGFGIENIVNAILNIISIKRKTNIKFGIVKNFCIMLFLTLPTAALAYFLGGIFSLCFPDFLTLILAGIITTIFYVSLCLALGAVKIETFKVEIEKRLKIFKIKKKKAKVRQ